MEKDNNMKLLHAVSILALTVLAGCATNSSAPPPNDVPDQVFADEYRIGIGDNLRINVWRNEDLSISVPVRPDGRISAPLVGDVFVGNRTPEEVAEELKQALASYIRDPYVSVIVTNIGSGEYLSRVRITGSVGRQSAVNYRPGMTVLDAVLDAGGVTPFANANATKLYRSTGEVLKVKLDDLLNRGDLSTNFYLKPGDVVTVPERLF